jgi:uncharacterized protein YdeI (YjbR/CyaY-like superfamily)
MKEALLEFPDADAFDQWLEAEHARASPVFLKLGKAGHPPHLTYAQALDVALRWGWIDSQKKALDGTCWAQRFGPRTKTSPWSKVNVGKAEALIAQGRMAPAGLREVERAKADGRWERAYAGSRTIEVPADLAAALEASPAAKARFATLDATNRFAFLYRLHALKTEAGRKKRLASTIESLERGELPHPVKPRT